MALDANRICSCPSGQGVSSSITANIISDLFFDSYSDSTSKPPLAPRAKRGRRRRLLAVGNCDHGDDGGCGLFVGFDCQVERHAPLSSEAMHSFAAAAPLEMMAVLAV